MKRTLAYWLGIVAAPSMVLAYVSGGYALVAWACRTQRHVVLDAAALLAAGVTLVALALAAWAWRHAPSAPPPRAERHRFLGFVATALSALSFLAVVAQWSTRFALGPCVS
jgi:hypothetical protein